MLLGYLRHSRRLVGPVGLFIAAACIPRRSPPLGAHLNVLNDAMRPVSFEVRVDGVSVLDTLVPPGGIPSVVLGRSLALRAGVRRIELLDRRLNQRVTTDFEARPGAMSIEIRLGRERSSIRTCYCVFGYM